MKYVDCSRILNLSHSIGASFMLPSSYVASQHICINWIANIKTSNSLELFPCSEADTV
jgi:hypothetical protein